MIPEMISNPSSMLSGSLLGSVVLLALTALAGFVFSLVSKAIYTILGAVFGNRFAFIFANGLAVPGVLHHELSHAIAALLTGARVRSFTIIPRDGALGQVGIVPRGSKLMQGLQLSFSAVAPVLFGIGTLLLSLQYILPSLNAPWQHILFWYLIVCLVLHMTLSGADWKNFLRGILGTWIILFAVCFVLQLAGLDFLGTLKSVIPAR